MMNSDSSTNFCSPKGKRNKEIVVIYMGHAAHKPYY